MSTQPKPYITEEQYVEMEDCAEQKSEYFRGEIFPIEVSIPHAIINGNLFLILTRELSGSSCRVFSNQMRLRVSEAGLYTYPDALVICGKLEVSEKDKNSVTNPTVIVEILSPTTEDYDRGGKFVQYRSIPSFREYLLIAQDSIHAEHWVKQRTGDWLLHDISNGEEIVSFESIGIRFKLSEAYAGVEL